MDFFIEFIFELLFEGSTNLLKTKSAAKTLRGIIIFFTVSMMILFFVLAYFANDNSAERYAFLGIGFVVAFYLSGIIREGINRMDILK